jgi:hypothetical protein
MAVGAGKAAIESRQILEAAVEPNIEDRAPKARDKFRAVRGKTAALTELGVV